MAADKGGNDPEALQHAVEELRKENEELRSARGTDGARERGSLWKRTTSWVLIVLACILAVVSIFVVFARNELLNTDAYVSTVAPLASDPAIQAAVAHQVSERLIAQTDVQQQVKQALPPRAGFLATPITDGLRSATEQITLKLVQSQQFQKLWIAANRASHKQLVALLTGEQGGTLTSSNGRVTVDLSKVEVQAKKALDAKGITVFNKVPAVKGLNFVLFQSDQLARFQRLTRLLNHLSLVLPIVTLLFFAGGVVLTRDRRRGLVRAAVGLALSMAAVLVVASVVRNQYLSSLDPSHSKAANAAAIDAVSALLLDTVRTVLIVAALIAIGGMVAGNARFREWVSTRNRPAWMTEGPVHTFAAAHRKGLQWAVLGLGLLILVVWSRPTARVAVIVVLVALALAGLVGVYAGRRPVPVPAAPEAGEKGPGGTDPV
ncbi:MAG TPA: hypothetical protein VMV06_06800 [Acidimicrobiales bacterium]|nr:hypothetical protein [Acidimicrobiales bacterium]